MNGFNSIAIDGPAGAGKSSLARRLSKELGYIYVDTGAIYRSVGLAAHRRGLDTKNEIAVSAMPAVRAYLLEMQRRMARTHNVIMDGRDIGTVVLPDAELKIFLTASAAARAQRRLLELQGKSVKADYDEVLRDIEYRDKQDTSRAAAPLKAAEDAVRVDTSDIDFEQSAALLRSIVRERLGV